MPVLSRWRLPRPLRLPLALVAGLVLLNLTASALSALASWPARLAARRAVPATGATGAAVAQPAAAPRATRDTAIFAGGCFWCMEEAFEAIPGVLGVRSGYIGGTVPSPSYEQVTSGTTGHYEAVEIVYDPRAISYARLVGIFWKNIDPFDATGQFCDKGEQYRAAIFPRTDAQQQVAVAAKGELEAQKSRFPDGLAVQVVRAPRFYGAEEYHQDYYKKNPVRYKFYKYSCGRAQRLAEVWG
jgi:peptide-methionine (S)-S-oxide reductase